MIYKVDVTAGDISEGIKYSCFRCPIALAINRTSAAPYVGVGYVRVGFAGGDLPATAQKFIRDFDEGKPVQPFSFELELE